MPGSLSANGKTLNLTTTRGRPKGAYEHTEDITRRGANGTEVRRTGKRAEPGSVELTWFTDDWASDLNMLEGDMVGHVGTFTTADDKSFDNCLIAEVQKTEHRAARSVAGASGTYVVDVTVVLHYLGD